MNTENKTERECQCDYSLAFIILRLWLGIRAILAGIEKFGAYQTIQKPLIDPMTGQPDPSGVLQNVNVKFYAFTNYTGVPTSFKERFTNEPLLPNFTLSLFNHLLGPALIITGAMLLLGLGTRLSLFVQGLIYTALTIGLILIQQQDGVAWLGIHIALVAFALMLARHNKFALLKKW
jgi:thiosulfate dehydrogenase [quinone] large subunit